jgi:hypothetical protein
MTKARLIGLPINDAADAIVMKKPGLLIGIVCVALGLSASGCCCRRCGQISVDLEDLCKSLRFHGPDCRHYPHSCPPCPYYDREYCAWRAPYGEMRVGFKETVPGSKQVEQAPVSAVDEAPQSVEKD